MTDLRGPPARRLADRVCDGSLAFFAGWTVVSIGVVALGGTLIQLLISSAVFTSALVALAAFATRRGPSVGEPARVSLPESPTRDRIRGGESAFLRLIVLAVGLGVTLLLALTRRVEWFWFSALVLMLVLGIRELRSVPAIEPARPRRGWEAALLVMAALSVVVTLSTQRPGADDAFYVNLAVAASDHPSAPLLAFDSMHGIPGVPMLLPVYKVHGVELLWGAIAYLTGREPLDVSHLVLPALAALLVPLAYARLFRLLVPGRWIFAVAMVLGFYLFVGEPVRGYANFALVHLQHGKAIFVSVVVPLILAYGLEFVLDPTRARWLRLAAVQIAAVGLTSTALWIAPALAGLALACGVRFQGRSIPGLLKGLLASIPVLALGLFVGNETIASGMGRWLEKYDTPDVTSTLFESALWNSFPANPVGFVALSLVLVGWALATTDLLRRVTVVLPLGVFVVFWNPYLAEWLAGSVIGVPTYWRVFWLLPFPVLLGVAGTAPLELLRSSAPRGLAPALCAVFAAAFLLLAPSFPIWSAENRVRLGWAEWKVPEPAFSVAREIVERAPSGATVLAPLSVSPWIPTLSGHPGQVVVREHYLEILEVHIGKPDARRRLALARLVSGRSRPAGAYRLLRDAIDTYPLALVCIGPRAADWPEVRRALTDAGLAITSSPSGHSIWVRPATAATR